MADQIDPHSSTARALREWAEKRLETTRRNIEAQGVDPATTEFMRGQLMELRQLTELLKTRAAN